MNRKTLSLLKAIQSVADRLKPPEKKIIDTRSSLGKYVACEVVAPQDLPASDISAEDGFLVSLDFTPGIYQVSGVVSPGTQDYHIPEAGKCLRIEKGAPVREGARVVPVKFATLVGTDRVHLEADKSEKSYMVRRGSLVKAGEVVLAPGERIDPRKMALLLSLGIEFVEVCDPPEIHVLCVDSDVANGKVPEISGWFLCSFLSELGLPSVFAGAIPDEEDLIREKVMAALPGRLVLACGGSSEGITDRTVFALRGEKLRVVCEGVELYPGQSCAILAAQRGCCVVIPGDPSSAVSLAYAFLRPALARWLGIRLGEWTSRDPLVLTEPWQGPVEGFFVRPGFVREGVCQVEPGENLLKARNLLGLPAGRALRRTAFLLA